MFVAPYILPQASTKEDIRRLIDAQFRIILTEREKLEPEWKIDDVVFEHDPDWRDNVWSIQAAHDCNHLLWKAVRVLWFTSTLAPYAAPYIVKFIF